MGPGPSAPSTCDCYPPISAFKKKEEKRKNCHIIAFLLASENIVRDSSELLKIHKDVNKAKQTKKEEEEDKVEMSILHQIQ